jgi:hypothetical protein
VELVRSLLEVLCEESPQPSVRYILEMVIVSVVVGQQRGKPRMEMIEGVIDKARGVSSSLMNLYLVNDLVLYLVTDLFD